MTVQMASVIYEIHLPAAPFPYYPIHSKFFFCCRFLRLQFNTFRQLLCHQIVIVDHFFAGLHYQMMRRRLGCRMGKTHFRYNVYANPLQRMSEISRDVIWNLLFFLDFRARKIKGPYSFIYRPIPGGNMELWSCLISVPVPRKRKPFRPVLIHNLIYWVWQKSMKGEYLSF